MIPFKNILVILIIFFSYSSRDLSAQLKINGIYELSEQGKVISLVNDSAQSFKIKPNPAILGEEFFSVKKKFNRQMNWYELLINLTETGKTKFAEVSKENIGKPLAIIIDGKLLAAPVVMAEITGGEILITGLEEDLVNEIVKYFKKR